MRLTGGIAHVTAAVRRARLLVPTGLSRRRQLISAGAAVVVLTLLTLILDARRDDVSTTIVFLLYLAAVVALSAAGGPIVGIAVAIVAFLLVNWFFTEPLHTLNVSDPERFAELIIFLAVSATVATLVDTAGRRRDVIEVRTAEAEQLAAANDLRTALLRAVSHDLRTPLTTAKLATSSLLASDVTLDEAQRHELVVLADREIDRLVLIVENLLDAGRLQAGALSVDVDETDLTSLVDRVISLVPEDDRDRVDNQVDDETPTVQADRALLERVVANLVSKRAQGRHRPRHRRRRRSFPRRAHRDSTSSITDPACRTCSVSRRSARSIASRIAAASWESGSGCRSAPGSARRWAPSSTSTRRPAAGSPRRVVLEPTP